MKVRNVLTRPPLESQVRAAQRIEPAQKVDPAKNDNRVAAAPIVKQEADHFAGKIRPFMKMYCLACHNDNKLSGGMSLEPFTDQATAMKDRKIWGAAAEVLRAKEMPPKGKPQPTDAERAMFLDWIENSLTRVDCGQAADPGRPTIRRLNKAEYNNTIRDLVGVDFQPAEDFPSDDVGYGFDNIGDVLTLSPILLEKYLTAAEKILDQAIVIDKPIAVGTDTFRPQNFRTTLFRPRNFVPQRGYPLTANGKVFVSFHFLYAGDYIIRGRVYGERAGKDLPRMEIQVDGKTLKGFDVDAREAPSPKHTSNARASTASVGTMSKSPSPTTSRTRASRRRPATCTSN